VPAIISDALKDSKLFAGKAGGLPAQKQPEVTYESDDSYMSEGEKLEERNLMGKDGGDWAVDQGDSEAFKKIKEQVDPLFKFYEEDTGMSLGEVPDSIRIFIVESKIKKSEEHNKRFI